MEPIIHYGRTRAQAACGLFNQTTSMNAAVVNCPNCIWAMEQYKKELIYEILDLAYPIQIFKTDIDEFTIKYGAQESRQLSYSRACGSIGQAIMHSLVLEGKLD